MADAHHGPNHDYHLLEPSIWPLATSLAVGVLLFGAVLMFHNNPSQADGLMNTLMDARWFIVGLGGAGFIASVFGWWSDVIKESRQGDHKPVVQLGLRYGMLFFIASEVMFFFAFFWAYFNFGVTEEVWPPQGTDTFNPIDMPLYNTVILLLSGVTVTWAHEAIRHGDRRDFLLSLGLTVLLGILFTCMQAVEYFEAFAVYGYGYNAEGVVETYPSTFLIATGFHGFHVIIGTTFLAVCWFRGLANNMTKEKHFGFEAAAWY
ncbi:MAG: cytochrome c oxidase subunit 3, partial [Alphaproteobacteria bacterium]|nr:cytochrome c oxidase subunit 3 [Alphaproteobacteria bacterium]